MLGNIMWFLAACSIQLALIYGFRKVTNTKTKVPYIKYLIIIPFALIMTIENYYHLSIVHTITSMLFYLIDYKFIFQKSWRKTAFFGTALWLFAAIIDFLTMFRVSFTNLLASFTDVTLLRAIDSFVLALIIFALVHIRKISNVLNGLYKKLKNVHFLYIQIFLILISVLALGFMTLFSLQDKLTPNVQTTLYILVPSVFGLICFYIYKEYQNTVLKVTNKYLIKNNDIYLKMINDYRILKHNIIHQLNGIKTVSNKKTIALIDDLINHYNTNAKSTHNIKSIPPGISGIIYEKIYEYEQNKINLEIDNKIETNIYENITPRSYNLLCEALGILLDNSLEACLKTEKKMLYIDMSETNQSYNIKMINTFYETLDLDKLGQAKYSTKKFGHGIGLFSLIGRKKIKVKSTIINDLFLNEIIIQKKKN